MSSHVPHPRESPGSCPALGLTYLLVTTYHQSCTYTEIKVNVHLITTKRKYEKASPIYYIMPQATENEKVTDGLLNYEAYIVGARLLAG